MFSSKTVSVLEKRKMMKFLTFASDFEKQPEEYEGRSPSPSPVHAAPLLWQVVAALLGNPPPLYKCWSATKLSVSPAWVKNNKDIIERGVVIVYESTLTARGNLQTAELALNSLGPIKTAQSSRNHVLMYIAYY